jgi:adenosylcobinamide-GDP ribazoletransferase
VIEVLVPPLVGAALLVTGWKVLTGGLHLDGLADCLDGLAGSHPAQRRAIMRDSRIGVFGAAGLMLLLILLVASLSEVAAATRGRLLLLVPAIGRVAPLLAGAWLRPATPGQGLAAAFAAGLSGWAGSTNAAVGLALATWLLGPWGAAIAAGALVVALLAAFLAARRLDGITGDVLGAVVELAELIVVLLGVTAAHRGLL